MKTLMSLVKFDYVFPLVAYSCIQFIWLSLLMPALAYGQNAPLVDTATVEAWHGGAAHNMHCIVESPEIYQMTSHSNARLLWALPVGTTVEAGQKVAEQDGYYLELQLAQLLLEQASANAQANYADKELARVKSLNQSQLVSSSNLNDIERKAAQASLASQRLAKQIEVLQYRLKHLTHYATEASQVLVRQALTGDSLSDGENILQLLPTTKHELMCELPLSKYRESEQLSKVKFTLLNGHTELDLNRLSLALDEQSQTVKLYLKSNAQALLLLGERVEVLARYHRSQLARVPYDALELTEEQAYVWQLTHENKVKRVAVNVIKTQPKHFLINGELTSGDRVITVGKQGLKDQQQVTIVKTSTGHSVGNSAETGSEGGAE